MSDTLQGKNADMQSIDCAGARVIFKPKCIPQKATVASKSWPTEKTFKTAPEDEHGLKLSHTTNKIVYCIGALFNFTQHFR